MGQKKGFICFLLKNEENNVCQRFLDGVADVVQRIVQMLRFAADVAHALLLLIKSNKDHDSSKGTLPRSKEECMTQEAGQV